MALKLSSLVKGDRMPINVVAPGLVDVKPDLLLTDRALDDDRIKASAFDQLPKLD